MKMKEIESRTKDGVEGLLGSTGVGETRDGKGDDPLETLNGISLVFFFFFFPKNVRTMKELGRRKGCEERRMKE